MTLALPSVFGMLINIIYNLADTFFVGQTGDANQVAAVSVSMPVFMIFLAIGNLFGVGGCAYISRSLGEGKKEKVKTISSFCAYASMIGGAIISVIFLIFRNPILRLIGASDNTIGYANDYMFWLAISSPLIVMGICASNLVRGEGFRNRHRYRSDCECNTRPHIHFEQGRQTIFNRNAVWSRQGRRGCRNRNGNRQCADAGIFYRSFYEGQINSLNQSKALFG